MKKEYKILALICLSFAAAYFFPVDLIQGSGRLISSLRESLHLLQSYAQEHVILCLIPAFFIAGAIAVFIKKDSVIKYLGPNARKITAYGVSSVSGSVLAVCSCTVLPLFSGIYKMGAGIGPAITFLYAGPAVNIMAIILTARVLGFEIGIARAFGAVLFSIIIGLIMHFIFKNEEKSTGKFFVGDDTSDNRLRKAVLYMISMTGILVFATWGKPQIDSGIWFFIFSNKWLFVSGFAVLLGAVLAFWEKTKTWKILLGGIVVILTVLFLPGEPVIPFITGIIVLSIITGTTKGEPNYWLHETWTFAKHIMALLFAGVIIAGFLLGTPEGEGLIPSGWISGLVGGNSISANLFASVAGAFMYFATLTEVPILQGLINSGMGKGPALALLLAGPALSLPNMLVIRSVIGTKKTLVFVGLVIIMAALSGYIFGIVSG